MQELNLTGPIPTSYSGPYPDPAQGWSFASLTHKAQWFCPRCCLSRLNVWVFSNAEIVSFSVVCECARIHSYVWCKYTCVCSCTWKPEVIHSWSSSEAIHHVLWDLCHCSLILLGWLPASSSWECSFLSHTSARTTSVQHYTALYAWAIGHSGPCLALYQLNALSSHRFFFSPLFHWPVPRIKGRPNMYRIHKLILCFHFFWVSEWLQTQNFFLKTKPWSIN